MRESGARLVTTRPERWSSIVRAVPDPRAVLFDPAAAPDKDREQTNAMERAIRSGDFSPTEATRALRAYGLNASLERSLGTHPLMFEIAAELGLADRVDDASRYRLIDDFVDRHVDEALDRLQHGSAIKLRARVRELASRLPADGSGALELTAAREAAGDDTTLGALISTGLLVEAGSKQGGRAEALRFTFDQVAEAMAPAPAAVHELFTSELCDDRAAAFKLVCQSENDGDSLRADLLAFWEALPTDAHSPVSTSLLTRRRTVSDLQDLFDSVWQM